MRNIQKIELNSGRTIPAIGFGTWQLEEGEEAKNAVSSALKEGYRLIDTAAIYGNEKSVGQGIKQSGVKRREVFVTTKLWNSDQGYDSALKAFDESLKRLGLEYIDLYLIHWPGISAKRRHESWRALQKLHREGRAKAVGVSNFSVKDMEGLLSESDLTPAVNQIPFHPFVYREQIEVVEFCKKNNIVIEAYSPLSRGALLKHVTITEIADKLNKTNAQILLRWAIQHGSVPIPKSAHEQRIEENLKVFDFEISDQDMDRLNSLS